jgi:hypothetical protein
VGISVSELGILYVNQFCISMYYAHLLTYITNILMNKTIRDILNTINQANPEELSKVYGTIQKMNDDEPNNPVVDSVFEVDGKMHRVPFEQLRKFLSNSEDVSDEPAKPANIYPTMKGTRIPALDPEVHNIQKPLEDMPDEDGYPYYWDDPANQYKHMSDDAVRDRVLRKK